MKITESGIYHDVSSVDYFADPTPTPSLTQSLAKIIIDQSPKHAWWCHPRLNPNFEPDNHTKFDVGNIAHSLLIGRGKEIKILDGFDDFRTKEARAWRVMAEGEGKIGVLRKHYTTAEAMVAAARAQLDERKLKRLFQQGKGEVCLAWQEDGDIWMRQLLDWLVPDMNIVADYKTTGMSVAAHELDRMMANAGWHIQAAMADRGLGVLNPEGQGRRRYLFVIQETDPPYLLNVGQMSRDALVIGHKQLQMAFDIWSECIRTNTWPGYPLEMVSLGLPGWTESQWLERQIAHAERRPMPSDLLSGG